MKVLRSLQFYIDHPAAKIVFELGYDYADFSTFTGFPHRQGPGGEWCHPRAPTEMLPRCYTVVSNGRNRRLDWLSRIAERLASLVRDG